MSMIHFKNLITVLVHAVLFIVFSAACSNREFTRTPRTGTEQLILSHALDKSMSAFTLPSPPPATVAVDVIGFVGDRQAFQPLFPYGAMINENTAASSSASTPVSTESNYLMVRPLGADLSMMKGFVERQLITLGYMPVDGREAADLWLRVMVLALGTDQGQSFFGMPAIQSSIIPFSTPPLVLYQAQRQLAYVRYRLQIYDSRSQKWHVPDVWYDGSAYYNQYTLLFFINFRGTNVPQVPDLP